MSSVLKDVYATKTRKHEKDPFGFVLSCFRGGFRKAAVIGAFILAVPLWIAWSASPQSDDLDVLKVIPENYKLIIDNQFVRVLEAHIPAGTEEKPHRHLKGVSVCLTEYTLESRILPDGQWVRNERKVGTTYWSDASLHQVRNVGTTTSHTIRIELKY
jgi:hypothetical protein